MWRYQGKKEIQKMRAEEIGVTNRLRMRGLKNKCLIEISQDSKTGDFISVVSRESHRK